MNKKIVFSMITATAVFAGCEMPQGPTSTASPASTGSSLTSLGNSCYLEEFPRTVQSVNALDVLFVVEADDAAKGDEDSVAQTIVDFSSQLPVNVGVRYAVLPAHGSHGSHSGKFFGSSGNPVVIDSTALSMAQVETALEQAFAGAPDDSSDGNGKEGLYSLSRALDGDHFNEGRKSGFFRSNAALAVIFISDSGDYCSGNGQGHGCSDCSGADPHSLLGKLNSAVKGRPLMVAGIVPGGASGYIDMIQEAGGVFADIGKLGCSNGLKQIGQYVGSVLQGTVDFTLSKSPVDPKSISVSFVDHCTSAGGGSHHHGDDNDDQNSCNVVDGSGNNVSDGWGGNVTCGDGDSSYSTSKQDLDDEHHGANSGGSCTPSSQVESFAFDSSSNTVHTNDPSATGTLADIRYCLITATPAPSPSATVAPAPSPSATVTPAPSPSATVTPAPSPSATVTPAPSPSATVTPAPSPSATVTPAPSPSATATPAPSPSATATPAPSPAPTATPAPSPTPTASPSPTCTGPFCGGGGAVT